MRKWKKTAPELVAAFDKAVPTSPGVSRRPMFGHASAFVNGNMFAGTFQDAIVVRLSATDREALLKLKGASPFEPMGRPMKEYVVVPASIVAKPKELSAWIERAHDYARRLRPKSKTAKPAAPKDATASVKSRTVKRTRAER